MKTKKIALLLLVGSLIATVCGYAQEPPPYPANGGADDAQQQPGNDQAAPAADPAAAGIDYFHAQLSPYGQWVAREGYGMVWVPNVAPGWRPYTAGHWAYTDQGWAWVADESWGWAPFHYGRWYYDGGINNWAWVPGYTWAPAWVDWRHGGGYLGWAPLPPAVGFGFGAGLVFGGVVIRPGFYTFVGERNIFAPRIGGFILPSARNTVFVSGAARITNYTVVNNRVVNVGVPSAGIVQMTGHAVTPVSIASMSGAGPGGAHGAFYQPPVMARASRVMPAEFGSNLSRQIAVQQKSQSYASVVHNKFSPAGGTSAAHGTTSVNGSRTFTRSTSSSVGSASGSSSGSGKPGATSGTFKPVPSGSQTKSTAQSTGPKSTPPAKQSSEKPKKPPTR